MYSSILYLCLSHLFFSFFFFLKSTDISESIPANSEFLISNDDTSLSKAFDPIELSSNSDSLCESFSDFLMSILEAFSSIFFFFLPIFDYPSLTLEMLDEPSTDKDASSTLYLFIGFKLDPLGSFFISTLISLSNLFNYLSIADVTETPSLI